MSTTVHRKDITHADFTLLAKFSWALNNSETIFGRKIYLDYPNQELEVPVWRKTQNGWEMAGTRGFTGEKIAIISRDFRRISRYLKTTEPVLADLLFRMSMLDLRWPDYEKRDYMQRFPDMTSFQNGDYAWYVGYVIEARRALGGFRK